MATENEVKQYNEILKDAQYRKNFGIAFFNATNSAIALITGNRILLETTTPEETKAKIVEYRVWFLSEHGKYYTEVIAKVGTNTNYKVEDAVAKLQNAKSKPELDKIWIALSADERHDGEIKKVAKELNDKFKNA